MKFRFVLSLLTLLALPSAAQTDMRKKIDKDRAGSFLDVKSYEKARSFIKLDSNYYVGYLMEGGYLYFRANDEIGFRKAAVPLQKALDKLERDYDALIRIRTNNYAVYDADYRYQYDYSLIAYFLTQCYQNLEQQDKAMEVLYHLRDRDFQVEMNMSAYNTMAWIYHRNRMYTSKQFAFLKNSVSANVRTANRYLDSALMKIRSDFPVNNGLYDPKFLNRQYLGTIHYKAMIYDYLLNADSANYYYDLLIENHAHSTNNYAEFKLAMGEMQTAEQFFLQAEKDDESIEKKTKEYYYMRGSLAIYRGHPEKADSLLKDVLQKQGSTPGYGWHSIGLARAKHFEGLTAESQDRADRAGRFQEMHIGTTWGREQYNLAVASLHYLNQLQFKKEYWFEHDEWYFWLNPLNWFRWIQFTLEIRHQKMILASLVAENPEREQVIYTIFSPENLITFDEVWSIIDGFGNKYFIDLYKKRLETDKRPRLKKYYRYFLGKLYLAEGEEDMARKYLKDALEDHDMEDPYQTLLKARIYEGLAQTNSGKGKEKDILELYRIYPQLLPFTDLNISLQLQMEGQPGAEGERILKDLRNTSIHFVKDSDAPVVTVSFAEQGKSLQIRYSVISHGVALQKGTLRIEENQRDEAGQLLAYRIFGIHKTKIGRSVITMPRPDTKNVNVKNTEMKGGGKEG